jgi:hypothetical protein
MTVTVTTKYVFKDMPATGLTGVGGEGGGSGWVGDLDMDLLIEAKGTTAKSEALALNVDLDDLNIVKGQNDTFVVTHPNVDDVILTLNAIERLMCTDKALALDVNGDAGEVYALLAAGLGQADITNELMGIGLWLKDAGKTDTEVAQILLDSSLYKADALGSSNETFVKHVWNNLTGTTISLADLNIFAGALDRKEVTQAQLLEAASNLTTFRDATHINLVGMVDTGIEYTPFGG